MDRSTLRVALGLVLVSSLGSTEDRGQADPTEWRHWGGSPGGVRYSALRDIHRENVGKLERAWTYDAGEIALGRDAPGFKSGFTTTPLVVGGVLYLSTPSSRVIALEPETGRELWVFDPQAGKPVREFNAHRGVSYWESTVRAGKPCERRIVFGTVDSRLMAIDAGTGKACADFGQGG
ncbi:MAG TPA: PQQ-binding-like beta-propeller repeat protein, partial [Vicinamibacteria bacterium]